MLKVGLTGGIASGKTTVAEMFRRRSCRVLNADQIAHDLIQPGQPAYDEIVRAFGLDILAANSAIDRRRLGQRVFADRNGLERLNQIVHPRVVAALDTEFARLAREDPAAIVLLEAALLIEAGYHRQLDKLVVTWCRPEQQVERLLKSAELTRAEAEQRVAAQLSQEEKRRQADYQIDCSGSLQATEEQVEKVLAELRRLTAARP
jgi:dephospho-CoA kinase